MILSIVIPAYNESENIPHTIAGLQESLSAYAPADEVEIIVVDDHSSEPMYEKLESLNDPNVHCIRLSRRSGSHVALRAGLAASRGDAILCISADAQEDPAAVPQMLDKWRQGAQVVWGLRYERSGESLAQKYFSLAFYKMLSTMTESAKDGIDLSRADFYLLDRQVVDCLNRLQENNTSLFGLIAWIGFKQDFIEYERRERRFGKSKWKFRARMRLAKDWIIAFSGLPLKAMTYVGFTVAALGMLYAAFILIRTIIFGVPISAVAGWTSLMIVVLVLGGLQMAMLGVVGEYLWRTLEETRRRSLYFVEKSTISRSRLGSEEAPSWLSNR